MNPTKQRLNMTTTTTGTTTTTTTIGSKLMQNELRCVPVAISTSATDLSNTIPSTASTLPAEVTSMLHVLPMSLNGTTIVNGAGALLNHSTAAIQTPVISHSSNGQSGETAMVVTCAGGGSIQDNGGGMTTPLPTALTVMQATTPGGPILMRNQPQYANAIGQHGAPLPILNHDLVKQIVVGNTPRTLLKQPLNSHQQSTANLLMPPLRKFSITSDIIPTTEADPLAIPAMLSAVSAPNIPELLYLHSTGTLPTGCKEAVMAVHNCPDSQPNEQITNETQVKTTPSSRAEQKLQPTELPPLMKKPVPITVSPKEVNTSKKIEFQHVPQDKQESLLKTKPIRVIEINTSPRCGRSKSLTSQLERESTTAAERRYSSASDGKVAKYLPQLCKKSVRSNDHLDGDVYEVEFLENSDEKLLELTGDPFESVQPTLEHIMTEIKEENDTMEEMDEKMKWPIDDKYIRQIKIEENETIICDNLQNNRWVVTETSPGVKGIIKREKSVELDGINTENTVNDAQQEFETVDANDIAKENENDVEFVSETVVVPVENSILKDEQLLIHPTSLVKASCNSRPIDNSRRNSQPLKRGTNKSGYGSAGSDIDAYSCVLDMMSSFNMLTWKERIGKARGTSLNFRLNDWNLLEVHERCTPRFRIHTAYEKPIYEREELPQNTEQADPLLYLCRRCLCHGPAADFLAPEFCSVECLKRDSRKRQRGSANIILKRPRKEPLTAKPFSQSNELQKNVHFRWSTYLTARYGILAAPVDLFLNPFPTGPNNFQVGMKLEAIDPDHCALFCVCTVTEIQGYRLRLSFDGYDNAYNFWVNADSMDIFPPGWCVKTNRILQPPKHMIGQHFNWSSYLTTHNSTPAPRHLFTHLNSSSLPSRNPFKIGMHLEAEDLNDSGKLCVATVADVLDDRIRIHFDGWDECYDYWVHISSPYIHSCGYHENRQQLIVPPDFTNSTFNWHDYIRYRGNGLVAHEEVFATRDPLNFKSNMKLEVVDPRNPRFIRPATVVGQRGTRLKLHLDCWPSEYCFSLEDDSPDLHPIGWSDATGHDLEPPPGYHMRAVKVPCTINGCRGFGNAKRFYLNTHATRDCCPYLPVNWRHKIVKPTRINSQDIIRTPEKQLPIVQDPKKPSPAPKLHNHNDEIQIVEQIELLDDLKTHRIIKHKPKPQQPSNLPDASACVEKVNVKKEDLKVPKTNEVSDVPETKSASASTPKASKSSSVNGDTPAIEKSIKIAKEFLCDYGPRLRQNYDIWKKNFAIDADRIKRNPLLWSTKETSNFVNSVLNCDKVAKGFIQEDIDGHAFLMLQQSDLTDLLRLKLGPAVKLYSCILQLRAVVVCKFNIK